MSVEKPIRFVSGALRLEGLYARGKSPKGVVLAHPHPLYGGDMENFVVHLLAQTFQAAGWNTLRFNFRGVGESDGKYDEGKGETEDVAAAVAYLKERGSNIIVLAGYSFGAWVNARAAQILPEVTSSILISPPVGLMDFSFLHRDRKTRLIVVGERDPYAPMDHIQALADFMPIPPEIRIIPGADHFFSFGGAALTETIRTVLTRL